MKFEVQYSLFTVWRVNPLVQIERVRERERPGGAPPLLQIERVCERERDQGAPLHWFTQGMIKCQSLEIRKYATNTRIVHCTHRPLKVQLRDGQFAIHAEREIISRA